MSEKVSLAAARHRHDIGLTQLAKEAGVERRTVYTAGIGGIIETEDAQKILAALSRLTGQSYTLENVALLLREERKEQETGR